MGKYGKSLLILFGALIAAGAGYVVLMSDFDLGLGETVGASGPDACAWEGEEYGEGSVRAAEDGCNTCVCTKTGWSCTSLSCYATGEAVGTVSGALTYPDDETPDLRVCAIQLKTKKKHCLQTVPGAESYALRVPAGEYWVYAENEELEGTPRAKYKAWYSEYLECGQGPDCKDHSPVTVTVASGEISKAHPNDWYADSWMLDFTMTPTNRKYGSTYHYNRGTFNARAKDMDKVEVWYLRIKQTASEPDDTVPKIVGEMELAQTGDDGFQTWQMPIPEDFKSSHVWAVGIDADGDMMKSWDIGWVKPDKSVL